MPVSLSSTQMSPYAQPFCREEKRRVVIILAAAGCWRQARRHGAPGSGGQERRYGGVVPHGRAGRAAGCRAGRRLCACGTGGRSTLHGARRRRHRLPGRSAHRSPQRRSRLQAEACRKSWAQAATGASDSATGATKCSAAVELVNGDSAAAQRSGHRRHPCRSSVDSCSLCSGLQAQAQACSAKNTKCGEHFSDACEVVTVFGEHV